MIKETKSRWFCGTYYHAENKRKIQVDKKEEEEEERNNREKNAYRPLLAVQRLTSYSCNLPFFFKLDQKKKKEKERETSNESFLIIFVRCQTSSTTG